MSPSSNKTNASCFPHILSGRQVSDGFKVMPCISMVCYQDEMTVLWTAC